MFTLSLEGNVNCLCLRGRTGANLHILVTPFDSWRRSVFDWGSRNPQLKHRKKTPQFSGGQIHEKAT